MSPEETVSLTMSLAKATGVVISSGMVRVIYQPPARAASRAVNGPLAALIFHEIF
jgi:hypothetical protein